MTSSTSCSGKRAALALAAALTGCAARGAGAPTPSAAPHPGAPAEAAAAPAPDESARRGLATRIALLPVVNLSGQSAPLRELQASLEAELRARGLTVASGGAVDELLARHRLRYTGGV